MKDPKIKKRKTYTLKLTKFELLHLRDLFSVSLPPALEVTLSQALATQQERVLVETKLWTKLSAACKEAKVPLGDNAPDFIVAASAAPSIGVFELAHDPNPQDDEEEAPTPVFKDDESEDE